MTETAPAVGTRYAGSRVPRVEDARLLTGRGTFVDDVQLAGTLHACFVRSPHARARILSVDASAAVGLSGVHAVFLASDLNPGVHEQWYTVLGPVPNDTPRPPLAEGEVRFVGDPVAVVIADSRYIAEDAADLVVVDYEPLTPVVDFVTAAEQTDIVHGEHGSNLIGSMAGAPTVFVDEVFAAAPHVISLTLDQQAQSACPMETRGIVAQHSRASDELTIYAATQAPHEVRAFASRMLAIPENRVRVIARDTGGGFGQKVNLLREDMCIMLAALKVDRPVKWIEDRRENLMSGGMSRHEHATARMAFDDNGLILAAQIDFIEDCGAYPVPYPVAVASMVGYLFPGPYRVPTATFTTRSIYTNTNGRTAYRAPWMFESLAREMLLDRAARQLEIDPVELRRRNAIRQEDQPYLNPNGFTFNYISPLETLELGATLINYEAFRREQAEARKQGRYLGIGTCTYVEPTTPGGGIAGTEGAVIRIDPSGKINVYVSGGSAGNSTETTVVQLTADALGADIADVFTIQNDTAVTPFGSGTQGSRSGSMLAGAVAETASVLRERIVAIAAHNLGAAPEDIELGSSLATVRGKADAALSLAEIARISYGQPENLPPGVPGGLESSGRYRAVTRHNWANATHVCTCEVDIETGRVTLLRYVAVEDCGAMINPNVVEGQIAGGAVQGIAGVLYEDLAYDESGNPLATTFMDYLVPTAAEVPEFEFGHVDTPGPGPGGYKGVGEGGVLGGAPAVANAVADALAPLGVEINKLPMSPSSLVELINASRS